MDVEITDVVLRDGLQDEDVIVRTEHKVDIAEALVRAGLRTLEVASFVSPARVPQMADAAEVAAQTGHVPARRIALALNAQGVRRAIDSGIETIQVAASASNAHSQANAGRDTQRAMKELAVAVSDYPDATFIGGISTAFICPFDGPVPEDQLVAVVQEMVGLGVSRVSLADTIGVAAPEHVVASLAAVQKAFPGMDVGLHLHDAKGQALQTVDAALEMGVRHFDSALGGYGGCPFAPGAHGNLATEALVAHLHAQGVATGINATALEQANSVLQLALSRSTPVPSVGTTR